MKATIQQDSILRLETFREPMNIAGFELRDIRGQTLFAKYKNGKLRILHTWVGKLNSDILDDRKWKEIVISLNDSWDDVKAKIEKAMEEF